MCSLHYTIIIYINIHNTLICSSKLHICIIRSLTVIFRRSFGFEYRQSDIFVSFLTSKLTEYYVQMSETCTQTSCVYYKALHLFNSLHSINTKKNLFAYICFYTH